MLKKLLTSILGIFIVISCATQKNIDNERDNSPLRIQYDEESGQILFKEGDNPILNYNFKIVDLPEGLMDRIASSDQIYAIPRANYIHPVYGPNGEEMTRDWAEDHPHHRGIYWAWPEVDWNGKRGDLHALQHVFAYPDGDPVFEENDHTLTMTANQIWTWEDDTEIVDETVQITVWETTSVGNFFELKVDLTAREDTVRIARRGTDAYGGLNMRLSHTLGNDQVTTFIEDTEFTEPRTWGHWRGQSPINDEHIGMVVLEHKNNPDYPGEWVTYPDMPWMQPTFPETNTRYTLVPGETLTLQYGFWIHENQLNQQQLDNSAWAYSHENFDQPHQINSDAFEFILDYETGQPRTEILRLEQYIRQSPVSMYHELEEALLHVVSHPEASLDARKFVCNQLQIVGSNRSVSTIVELLDHVELAHSARNVLLSLDGTDVNQYIREALEQTDNTKHLSGLIDLLALKKDFKAISVISEYLGHSEDIIVFNAINALGHIGGMEAVEVLANSDLSDRFNTEIGDALIQGSLSIEDSHRQQLMEQLISDEWEYSTRTAALSELFELDSEAAFQYSNLWIEQGSPEQQYVSAILIGKYASEDVTVKLVPSLEEISTPHARLVINSAVKHNNQNLLPQILNWMDHDDPSLQVTALEALEILGNEHYVMRILPLAESADERVAEVARRTLVRMPDDGINHLLLSNLDGSEPQYEALILRLLADRRADEAVTSAKDRLDSSNQDIRHAAWYLLAALGDEQDLPEMTEALLYAEVDDLSPITRALNQVSNRAANQEEAMELIIGSIDQVDAEKRAELLPMMIQFGDERALETILRYISAEQSVVRESAFQTLTDWPNPEAIPHLIAEAGNRADQESQWEAIDGTIRLLPQWTGSSSDRDHLIRQLNSLLTNNEERVKVLEILPDYASTITFEWVVDLYKNYPSIKKEAELAINQIALPDDEGRGGLWNTRTIELLEEVKEITEQERLRQKIADYFISRRELEGSNLALNASVNASESEAPYTPERAVDGEIGLDSYWASNSTPAWLEVDLGEEHRINQIDVTFVWDGSRYYQFVIEGSLDSEAWFSVIDYSDNESVSTRDGFSFEFSPVDARYVRITVLESADVHGVEISGAHIVNMSIIASE
jgi:HEAT repeat protein